MVLLVLSCAWMAGVLLGALLPWGGPPLAGPVAGFALGTGIAVALGWQVRWLRWAAGCLGVGLLGLAYTFAAVPPATPPAGSLRSYNVPARAARAAPPVTVRGIVRDEPHLNSAHTSLLVEVTVEDLGHEGAWQRAPGGLLVVAGRFTPVHQGDRISATGVVQEAPTFSGFDYRAYLLRQGLGSYMRPARVRVLAAEAERRPLDGLATARRQAGERLARAMPEPQAGLLRGIILGEGYVLDPDLRDAFGGTGTAHIIAVSGSNVTLVVAFVFLLVRRRLRLALAVPLALVVITLYVLIVGLEAPVLRAGIMGGLYLVAQALGRPAHALTLLGAAAWALTLLEPLSVLQVGFQLSFAAMLGILLLAPQLVKRWHPVPRGLREGLAVGVAASLFSYPLYALHFGSIPLIGVLASLLLEPLLAPIMALGWAAVLLGVVWAPLGQVVALLCWVPLSAMITIVEAAARVPAGLSLPDFGALELVAWYGALALLLVAWTEPGRLFIRRLAMGWPVRGRLLHHRGTEDTEISA